MQPISQVPQAPVGDSAGGGEGVGATLAQAKQTVTQGARDATAKLKHAASDAASRAREEAARVAQEKKETAAQRIGGYGAAMHDSARAFEEQDPNIAWFAHRAADRIQRVADYVRTRDFGALRRDAEAVARRHPAVFFGGLFLAGLMLGNVAKAGRRARDDDEAARDWEPEGLAPAGAPENLETPAADVPLSPERTL
jgi:hypothetical protein